MLSDEPADSRTLTIRLIVIIRCCSCKFIILLTAVALQCTTLVQFYYSTIEGVHVLFPVAGVRRTVLVTILRFEKMWIAGTILSTV